MKKHKGLKDKVYEKRKENVLKNPWLELKLIVFKICVFLDPLDLERVQQVCFCFFTISSDEKLWRRYLVGRWGEYSIFYGPYSRITRKRYMQQQNSSENAFPPTATTTTAALSPRTSDSSASNSTHTKIKWRDLVKYREYMEQLYKHGNIQILKNYNQADLKIMMLSSNSIEAATKNLRHVNPSVKKGENMSNVVAKTPEDESVYWQQYKNLLETDSNQDKKEDLWLDSGFFLNEVKLMDGRVCLNVRRNQKMKRIVSARRYSYDISIYSLLSTNTIYHNREQDFEDDENSDNDNDVNNEGGSGAKLILKQWVSKVRSYSGAFNSSVVNNVIGVANTYPKFGHNEKSIWSQDSHKGSTEFLELEFEKKIFIKSIHIYETFSPGSISEISALKFNPDSSSEWVLLWKGPPKQSSLSKRSRIFSPKLKKTTFKTNVIKVVFDTKKSKLRTEIDAVMIRGSIERNAKTIHEVDSMQKEDISLSPTSKTKNLDKFYPAYDMIKQQKHILHFPYNNTCHSPFDFNGGHIGFIYLESLNLHTTQTLVVVGATEMNRDMIYLEATYSNASIVKIKLFTESMSCMVIVRSLRVPSSYLINIWDFSSGKLVKHFDMKQLSTEKNSIFELSSSIVCCAQEDKIYIYDISSKSVDSWHLIHTIKEESAVTCASLNSEIGEDVFNLLVVGTVNGSCTVYNIFTGEKLFCFPHYYPLSSVKLVAGGGIIATTTYHDSKLLLWSIREKRCIRIVDPYEIWNALMRNKAIGAKKSIINTKPSKMHRSKTFNCGRSFNHTRDKISQIESLNERLPLYTKEIHQGDAAASFKSVTNDSEVQQNKKSQLAESCTEDKVNDNHDTNSAYSDHFCLFEKSVDLYDGYFTFYAKGSNEFLLGRFTQSGSGAMFNRYALQRAHSTEEGYCSIL